MKRCINCKALARDDAAACVRCSETRFNGAVAEVVDDRYAIEHTLGAGAMGIVYLARDLDLGREVALKVVGRKAELGPRTRDLVRREAAALAAIRNQHVVQVYDFGAWDEGGRAGYFFAMEFVRGRSLEELIDDFTTHRSGVPIHRALTILLQIASGLFAVHEAGIVHRDVKPSNVVVESGSGRPVLVDFGLAERQELVKGGHAGAGTPLYMAPERALGKPLSDGHAFAADQYAFGCTAFELLAGRPPFLSSLPDELIRLHALTAPPRMSQYRVELAPLDPVLARALAKQPEQRFASMRELRAALEQAGKPWLVTPMSTAPPPRNDTGSIRPNALRVLVVDDDESFRRFAGRAVHFAMPETLLSLSAVGSGAEAIESAQRHSPDLVILDYDMPGLDGLDTLSNLRALPGGLRARVVVVSGRTGAEERWRFEVLGVHDFVGKPVQLPALVQTLYDIAKANGWTREVRATTDG